MTTLADYLSSIRQSLDIIEQNGKPEKDKPSHENEISQIDDLANKVAEIYERHGEV